MTMQDIMTEIRKLSRPERVQMIEEIMAELEQESTELPQTILLTSPIFASPELIEAMKQFIDDGKAEAAAHEKPYAF